MDSKNSKNNSNNNDDAAQVVNSDGGNTNGETVSLVTVIPTVLPLKGARGKGGSKVAESDMKVVGYIGFLPRADIKVEIKGTILTVYDSEGPAVRLLLAESTSESSVKEDMEDVIKAHKLQIPAASLAARAAEDAKTQASAFRRTMVDGMALTLLRGELAEYQDGTGYVFRAPDGCFTPPVEWDGSFKFETKDERTMAAFRACVLKARERADGMIPKF